MNKKLFGVECPGCGTQRALASLAHGDFVQAFEFFPAVYTTILMFILLGLHILDKRRNYEKIVIAAAIANGVIMIISYIYKMTNQS